MIGAFPHFATRPAVLTDDNLAKRLEVSISSVGCGGSFPVASHIVVLTKFFSF